MQLHLEIARGRHRGEIIPISSRFLIGTARSCNLRTRSRKISEWHCGVLRQDAKFVLRDLNSESGTFVNDRPVRGEVELRDQDRFRVGKLRFIVHLKPEPVQVPLDLVEEAPELEEVLSQADLEEAPAEQAEPGEPEVDEAEIAAILLDTVGKEDSSRDYSGWDEPAAEDAFAEAVEEKPDINGGRRWGLARTSPDEGTAHAAEVLLNRYGRGVALETPKHRSPVPSNA